MILVKYVVKEIRKIYFFLSLSSHYIWSYGLWHTKTVTDSRKKKKSQLNNIYWKTVKNFWRILNIYKAEKGSK